MAKYVKIGTAFLLLLVLVAHVWAQTSPEQTPSGQTLREEQAAIESDTELGNRARRVLFKARANQDKGDLQAAIETISRWVDDQPDHHHHLLFFNRASSYGRLDDQAHAYQDLEKAVALAPRFGRAWLLLAETAYDLERFNEAGDAFAQAYDLTSEAAPEFLYYAGVTKFMGGQPQAARIYLERVLLSATEKAPLEWYQAYLATVQEAGPTPQTNGLVDQLVANHQADGGAWRLAAQAALGGEDYERASIYLTVADYLAPLSQPELTQLGDLYAVINVPLQAARYFERALISTESAAKPVDLERLASAYLAAHKEVEARQAISRGLELGATVQLWSLLGDLDYMARDYAAALAAFQECQALDPEFGRGWLMMGYCALELGDKGSARGYLEKAEKHPNQASSARTLLRRLK